MENSKKVELRIKSFLEKIDKTNEEISIKITEDGTPMAVAFFDIDKTLAELKDIHGKAISELFKNIFEKDFNGIEDVYFKGFRLGNSFREFDRMNCIYNLNMVEYIDPEIYIKNRLNYKKKDIDNEGTTEHKIAKMYLEKYVEIASSITDDLFKSNPNIFELSKIKPVFALAKFYKSLGIPMFGITANGKKFVQTISKYLGLSELFIDIATDEDMVGGGKEIVIPKLIEKIKNLGINISEDKLVIVGDSLYGDIGSGYRYKINNKEVFIKGILVLKDFNELAQIKKQISNNKDLQKIISNTDTEAFLVNNVKFDKNDNPIIYGDSKDFLVKLL